MGDAVRIHPTAIIEPDVEIGEGSAVWDGVHVRGPSCIGELCIIGEKTYIAYGVEIGSRVKINAGAYICTGVTIEDRAMVSAGVIFTNDRHPRAFDPQTGELASSAPNENTLTTRVEEGATIGAGAIIGPGLRIGAYAMVGMGSVVTRDIPAYGLVVGNPAQHQGFVCLCGAPLGRAQMSGRYRQPGEGPCGHCGRRLAA